MTEEKLRYLLSGAVDMHVHAGPSISPRAIDIGEMAKEAMEYGMKGFVAKDHYFCSTGSCQLVNKYICGGKAVCFGMMVMNNSVGGFNLKAVSTACEMGTKVISMSTVSAKEHLEFNLRPDVIPFKAAGVSSVVEKPLAFTDDNGEVLPEVEEILAYIAKYYPSVVLAMGHGSSQEIDKVIEKAVELGVHKIYVNHPFFIVDADLSTMKHWADKGCFLELNALNCYKSITRPPSLDPEALNTLIKSVKPEHLVISTDMGQKGNPRPALMLAEFMQWMMDVVGIEEEAVFLMAKTNPAFLLDI